MQIRTIKNQAQSIMKSSLELICGGVLLLSIAASFPRIRQFQIESDHTAIATNRAKTCLILGADERITEGYNYADRLDPTKEWTRNGNPTIEGDLLQGVNQSICDIAGSTAEVGVGGAAQNLRVISPDDMSKSIKNRFPDGKVPFSAVATRSKRFVPNFEARKKEAEKSQVQTSKTIQLPGSN